MLNKWSEALAVSSYQISIFEKLFNALFGYIRPNIPGNTI